MQGTFLRRGDTVSLTEKVPNLTAVTIRFGWDLRGTDGDFDLDASAIMVDSKGMVLSSEHFVFFNNLRSPEGSVVHSGDFPTGEDEAYDNAIKVNLAAVPGAVEKIVLPVSVYDAESRMQTFRQVKRAFIRIVDPSNNLEVASYDLADDAASPYTALVFGELYRRRRGWDFRGGGKGYTSGLWGVARDHGVNV
ncbi:TerD family protein [Streptomyces sp. NBC_01006]|uniref:TerD family protein n=1 Tax=Streptomyces sp. NBC_01006 TaxID=2903716 RepID=UPI0038705BE7|nr:TerD family protein [Streptomyces sp. NBC_01006]